MTATFNLNGGDVPWTTTLEDRIGPGYPYTDPSIQANLFFRVTLGIVSIFISFVPARLLWWSGEFAATAFCINTAISNFVYVINALIWYDNNVETWSAGYGWCDVQVYVVFALQTSYNICLFEIMRGLANKVAAQRIGALTASEKRRQHLISALVIFTLPVLQVALTYFVISRRYNVSTLAGCTAVYDSNWIFLIFFVMPSPIFMIGAAVMAVVAFMRVRQIQKTASDVLHFRDNAQLARQKRVKRKLYFLTFSILLVVVPVVSFFFVANIMEGMPWTTPYDLKRIHYGPDPYNIHSITFTTTEKMGFGDLAVNYVSVLSAISVFMTFGTTPEAYNEYRKCLLFLGLGHIFPKLHDEYKPKPAPNEKSWWSSFTDSIRSRNGFITRLTSDSRKGSLVPTTEHISLPNNTGTGSLQEKNYAASHPNKILAQKPFFDNYNPWPDLSVEEMAANPVRHEPPQHHILRNPWKPFRLPSPPKPAVTNPPTPTPFEVIHHESQRTIASEKQPNFNVKPVIDSVYSTTVSADPTTMDDNEDAIWEGFTQGGSVPSHLPRVDSSNWCSGTYSTGGSAYQHSLRPNPPATTAVFTAQGYGVYSTEGSTNQPSLTPNPPAVTAMFTSQRGEVRIFTRCPTCQRWGYSDDAVEEVEAGQRASLGDETSVSHLSIGGGDRC